MTDGRSVITHPVPPLYEPPIRRQLDQNARAFDEFVCELLGWPHVPAGPLTDEQLGRALRRAVQRRTLIAAYPKRLGEPPPTLTALLTEEMNSIR